MNSFGDGALAAMKDYLDKTAEEMGLVRLPKPRDYVACNFCGGGSAQYDKGCVACYAKRQAKIKEVDAECKRQFPDGPKLFFTAKLDSEEEMEQAKRVIGKDAIVKAFSKGGGGIEEIMANAETEMAKRDKKGVE